MKRTFPAHVWDVLSAAPAAQGGLAASLIYALFVCAAAAPFAGWRLATVWLVATLPIILARARWPEAQWRRGDFEIEPFVSLLGTSYSAAAFYLVFFHGGAAQTLGVTMYGVMIFQVLARDYARPGRLMVNLAPPIASIVVMQAAALMLIVKRGAPLEIVTLLASPYVVFRTFRAVQHHLKRAFDAEREALEQLRESEARYRLIAERSPDVIVQCDRHGRVEYLSPAARIYGWDPDELGNDIADYLHPTEAERSHGVLALLAGIGAAGEHDLNIWRGRSGSGDEVIFEARATPIVDDDGRLAGAVGVLRDITSRVALEDELRRKQAEAEAASVAKSAFLATVSHEIRTPLNGVLGMVQAMERDELAPAQRERLEVIGASGAGLLSILNDVLDISKIEAGKLELEDGSFDLEETTRGAIAAFTAAASAKGIAIQLEVPQSARGVYRGDPVRVRQILANLVSNAVKFTEAGQVTLSARRTSEGLHLAVADTGPGIPADQLDHLFEKFFQGDASTTRRYGGTGLGLAICAELARAMGGRIFVDSLPGQGSTFSVTLPTPRLSEARSRPPLPAVDDGPMVVAGSNLRVLAAEDNPTNQLVLKTILAQAGIDPVVVDDGAAAVEAWEVGDWDLILMDAQMPVMDGPTAARRIRAREAENGRRPTPIIALTANAMTHQVDEYVAAGMDGLVAKPIRVSELIAAINEALAARPAERAALTRGFGT